MCDDWIFIAASPKAQSSSSGPLPIPESSRPFQPRPDNAVLVWGGLPVPKPKSRPQSLSAAAPKEFNPFPAQPLQLPAPQRTVSQVSRTEGPVSLNPPRDRKQPKSGTVASHAAQMLRLKSPSLSPWLVQEWNKILRQLGQVSTVFEALQTSSHPQAHASRILDQFAPSTLLRYFSAWQGFQTTLQSLKLQLSELTESQLADALITQSLGKKSDCSAGCQITIKAIRWISTHAGVDQLHIAWNPMVESFLKSRIPKELKESIPFSLYTLAQLERRILMSSCPTLETVLIGAILACTWAGLRFADAQRCSFKSFCYDGKSLRGSCWRTKTSSRGQPWGITSSGFLSLGDFSWIEKWLTTLDQLWFTARSTDMDMPAPDFLFPQVGQDGIVLPWSPMSYADALFWIRKMTSLPWKSAPQPSQHWTAHSMKSTFLSWGAQMIADGQVTQEERLLQGHHRQSSNTSLRVYSRDDVHGQLAFQSKVIKFVRRGGRFATPQHRGAQHPITEPTVQIEFFRKASLDYEWKCFQFSGAPQPEPAPVDHASASQVVESSSDSSSGSSDSDSDSSQGEVKQIPSKKSKLSSMQDACEEVLIGASTSVQHAMLTSPHDWYPYFAGAHYQAACGAHLDPDRTKFFHAMDPSLNLCQRAACMKAWKAILA